jgi:hypothetical protein
MSKALRRRLAKLEAKTNAPPRIIICKRLVKPTGELCDSNRAETVEGEVWTRNSGESIKEFENRVVKDLSKRETWAFAIQVLFLPRESHRDGISFEQEYVGYLIRSQAIQIMRK